MIRTRKSTTPTRQVGIRRDVLREILSSRRRELQAEVQRHLRARRSDRPADVHEALEHSEANNFADIGFALLEMKGETMRRIDEALSRVETGTFGSCGLCGVEISETRLRALPFAVRCTTCETAREQTRARRATDGDEGMGRQVGLDPLGAPRLGV